MPRTKVRALIRDPVLQQRPAKYMVLQCFREPILCKMSTRTMGEDLHDLITLDASESCVSAGAAGTKNQPEGSSSTTTKSGLTPSSARPRNGSPSR